MAQGKKKIAIMGFIALRAPKARAVRVFLVRKHLRAPPYQNPGYATVFFNIFAIIFFMSGDETAVITNLPNVSSKLLLADPATQSLVKATAPKKTW